MAELPPTWEASPCAAVLAALSRPRKPRTSTAPVGTLHGCWEGLPHTWDCLPEDARPGARGTEVPGNQVSTGFHLPAWSLVGNTASLKAQRLMVESAPVNGSQGAFTSQPAARLPCVTRVTASMCLLPIHAFVIKTEEARHSLLPDTGRF